MCPALAMVNPVVMMVAEIPVEPAQMENFAPPSIPALMQHLVGCVLRDSHADQRNQKNGALQKGVEALTLWASAMEKYSFSVKMRHYILWIVFSSAMVNIPVVLTKRAIITTASANQTVLEKNAEMMVAMVVVEIVQRASSVMNQVSVRNAPVKENFAVMTVVEIPVAPAQVDTTATSKDNVNRLLSVRAAHQKINPDVMLNQKHRNVYVKMTRIAVKPSGIFYARRKFRKKNVVYAVFRTVRERNAAMMDVEVNADSAQMEPTAQKMDNVSHVLASTNNAERTNAVIPVEPVGRVSSVITPKSAINAPVKVKFAGMTDVVNPVAPVRAD